MASGTLEGLQPPTIRLSEAAPQTSFGAPGVLLRDYRGATGSGNRRSTKWQIPKSHVKRGKEKKKKKKKRTSPLPGVTGSLTARSR